VRAVLCNLSNGSNFSRQPDRYPKAIFFQL
jgi:hypothetical protein